MLIGRGDLNAAPIGRADRHELDAECALFEANLGALQGSACPPSGYRVDRVGLLRDRLRKSYFDAFDLRFTGRGLGDH